MERDRCRINFGKLLPELGSMLLAVLGVYIVSLWQKTVFDIALCNMVMAALGVAVTGFQLRRQYLNEALSYDNAEHLLRFWTCFMIGLMTALICTFLPTGGWPFLPLFVMLSLFSNISTGMIAGASLLMIPVLVSGASVNAFFLYFVSGILAAALFGDMGKEFKIGLPLLLSMLCLLICETAGIILPANARLNLELFLVPAANVIISCILLLGILRLFSTMVVYKYREKYFELNDSENQLLSDYKERARADYFQCVHTSYFCERIAQRLMLDVDALKCAGYYHKWGEELPSLLEEKAFPPKAAGVLREFAQKSYTQKETAVLVCADTVVSTISYMLSKSQDKTIDYEQIIDAVFKRFMDNRTFRQCDITERELNIIQKIFKEEKLYYDFLR
ncbi:MAG: hypothetical protein ACI4R5_04125 [Acetatifactor sp.]